MSFNLNHREPNFEHSSKKKRKTMDKKVTPPI